ncbi:unnamed protein product [Eruca vesicaria subsp. sativa]|uniref:Receptor-like serine/threonine-protein kinase n=1 Tax=Eruca vesicaria subsp. sativa TaxID=29727 RepID=A0ABC8KGI5_ERUVS|nr:unnamed protein product [Eruca vesicaria subsp. sativa]
MWWSNSIFFTFFTLSLLLGQACSETDTLLQRQYLKDGQELVSAFNIFRLKFFNIKNSRNYYLGIFYDSLYLNDNSNYDSNQDKPVWIANRDNPIPGRSGRLTVDSLGRLKILTGASSLLDLSSTETTGNTTLKLLDSGNLQLQEMASDGSLKQILWQSFDYPTDTLLPGMKIGFNVKTGKRWELTSWLGDDLPASGSFVFGMDANITNRLTILWRGDMYWGSGLWFKGRFSLEKQNENGFFFSFVSTEIEEYFMYSANERYDGTTFPRLVINEKGTLQFKWINGRLDHVKCSPFVLGEDLEVGCSRKHSSVCLRASYVFREPEPKFWDCEISSSSYSCSSYGYTFRDAVSSISGSGFVLNETGGKLSSYDCYVKCLQNCSCIAYASTSMDGTGCQIWNTDPTIDLTGNMTSSHSPITIHIRVTVTGYIRSRLQAMRVSSAIDQEMLLRELGIDRRGRHRRSARKNDNELQIFSFESVALATDYFSDANKLGEGGFGPVYKGRLIHWEEVAIKRLSIASGQGLVEFKNEAMLIAKLQHTNLVKLIGCCVEKDEKMLIYEYMPNKSLDYFLFDPLRKNVLDWTLRFRIMEGIIQGLLYLHKYSRLKVIHRDIKASNILLDEDMNPKISDFGMARIFGAQESRANTRRVAGTFGYMSPEYFREGLFSAKSDVFSFGVLMLEIICGRKNNSFHHDSEGPLNLIVHAWNLFKENRIREVIDQSLGDSALDNPQVLRCVQVALLCVQESAEDRPSMLDVVSMIYGNNALSSPKEPAFYDGPRRSSPEMEIELQEPGNGSDNRVTITVMEAR